MIAADIAGGSWPTWAWARAAAAAATLAVLVWRLGAGPFLDGVRAIDAPTLAAAAAIGVLTTVCCAWRWRLVARGLGVALPLRTAVAAYYRSLFLNSTLPGGVLGDVHRGVSHGRDVGDVSRGCAPWSGSGRCRPGRAVVLALAVLLAFPSPVGSVDLPRRRSRSRSASCCSPGSPARARATGGCGAPARRHPGRAARPRALPASCSRPPWSCSATATFLVAARTAGATAPPSRCSR